MKLSIIVPVYNLENYIATTLESLLSIQFSFDYEIVVINDGSKDGSESVIRSYQQTHSQIVLYTIENQGVSNARNFGISKAKGEYITFVDGDDTVEPDFYEQAVRELDYGGFDFVQGNYVIIDNEKMSNNQHIDQDTELSDFQEMMDLFFRPGQEKKIHNNVWGKVFRAEVARKISFDESLAVAEDQKYVFDVLCIAKKIKLLRDNCIYYYQRESSVTHTFNITKEQGKLAVFDYCESNIPYPKITTYINWHRMNIHIGLYWYYTKNGDPQAGEIRKILLKLYSQELIPFLNTKIKLIMTMLRYTRCVLDLYIRRKSGDDK